MNTYSAQKVAAALAVARIKLPLLERLTRARIELRQVEAATLTRAERSAYDQLVGLLDSEDGRRAMTEREAARVLELLRALSGEGAATGR